MSAWALGLPFTPVRPWLLMSLLMVPPMEASTLASSMGVHRIGLLPTLEVFELQQSAHCAYRLKSFNISCNITPSAFENNYNTSCGGAAGLPDSKNIPIFHSHNNTTPSDLQSLLYLPPILWPGFHDRHCPGIRVRCTSIVTLPCGAIPHRCPSKSFDMQVNITRLDWIFTCMHSMHFQKPARCICRFDACSVAAGDT